MTYRYPGARETVRWRNEDDEKEDMRVDVGVDGGGEKRVTLAGLQIEAGTEVRVKSSRDWQDPTTRNSQPTGPKKLNVNFNVSRPIHPPFTLHSIHTQSFIPSSIQHQSHHHTSFQRKHYLQLLFMYLRSASFLSRKQHRRDET